MINCGIWNNETSIKYFCAALNLSQQSAHDHNVLVSFSNSSTGIELMFQLSSLTTNQHQQQQQQQREQEERDLIRRSIDTSISTLHPPVDHSRVEVEFSSEQNKNKNVVLVVRFDSSLLGISSGQQQQYTICGYVCSFELENENERKHDDDDNASVMTANNNNNNNNGNNNKVVSKLHCTLISSSEQEHSIFKAIQKRRKHIFCNGNSSFWKDACDLIRVLYISRQQHQTPSSSGTSHKKSSSTSESQVVIDPHGIMLNCLIVGECSRYYYLALKENNHNKDDDDDDEKNKDDCCYRLVGRVHRLLQQEQQQSNSKSNDKFQNSAHQHHHHHHPPSWLLGVRDMHVLNVSSSGSSGIKWYQEMKSTTLLPVARIISYRIMKEKSSSNQSSSSNNSKNYSLQLEDAYLFRLFDQQQEQEQEEECALTCMSDFETAVNNIEKEISSTVGAIRHNNKNTSAENNHHHHHHEHEHADGTIKKTLLRRLSDPTCTYPQDTTNTNNKKQIQRNKKLVDSLFENVLGLPSSGGALRIIQQGYKLKQEDETQCVEFKQQIHQYHHHHHHQNNTDNQQQQQKIKTTNERVRRVLAAFANTRGGLLLVGVSDRGELLGIENSNDNNKNENLLRTTGFLPGMASNGVSHIQLQIQSNNNNNNNNSEKKQQQGTTPATVTPKMNWWKSAGTNKNQNTQEKSSSSAKMTNTNINTKNNNNNIVHVYQIQKGSAPFYSTPGIAAPPVRGQASTLPLSVISMTERVALELVKMMMMNQHQTSTSTSTISNTSSSSQQQDENNDSSDILSAGSRRGRED